MDDTSNIIIPIVTLIILGVFFIFIFIVLCSSNFQSTTPDNPVTSDNRRLPQLPCLVGQCATNIYSGQKRCPENPDDIVNINAAFEVCSDKFTCNNPLLPYAYQSDSSANFSGDCEPGIACPCNGTIQCPIYISSIFTTNNGNPYENTSSQRISFPQITSYTSNNGSTTSVPPISYRNPGTNFCTAPLSWLPISTPGCNFVSNPNSMTFDDLQLCMNLVNRTDANLNPCLKGVLSIITNDSESINRDDINTYQYGCVSGTPCPLNFINVYDTNYGGIVCKQLLN